MAHVENVPATVAPWRAARSFRPYVPIAVFTIVVALVGFWANYYGRILTGTVTTPPIIQFHAAVFLGWLLLVTAQAVLAQAFNDWVMALYT
jgi:hypothetical protein